MAFATDIESSGDIIPATVFRFASQKLDPEWFEKALDATGTRSIRCRKLPAQAVR